jgi:signal transduction histidine kinase
MSDTRSTRRSRRLELAWFPFVAANLAAIPFLGQLETVPFHVVWVSFALLYGLRVRGPRKAAVLLGAVVVLIGGMIAAIGAGGSVVVAEATDVPLITAMFAAMVWCARQRQSALEDARRAAETERDFVRDASHQLRTPITIARGHAELVRDEVRGRAVDDMDVVLDELDRLARIADRLLLLAAAEQPNFLHRRPLELEALLTHIPRRWSAAAPREWLVDLDVAGTFEVDEERLTAALDAVIENAVKFSAPASAITFTAREERGHVVIRVADRGCGIDAARLPTVFDRFAGDGTDGRRGTGLGLGLARAIVQAHGGSIELASVPGAGTAVTVRIPLARQRTPRVAALAPA